MDEKQKPEAIEEKLGFGTYMAKQAYQIVVSFGGLIGGAYTGLLAAKPFFKDVAVDAKMAKEWSTLPILSKLPGLKNMPSLGQLKWGAGGGAAIGVLTASSILGYEHWKKIKQSQLQVDEITRDISDIEVFKKTDPELKRENERLWTELKAVEKQRGEKHGEGFVAKTGATKHESWKDVAAQSNDVAAEASR